VGQRLGAVFPIVVIGIVANLAVDILLDVEIVLTLRSVGSRVGHRICRERKANSSLFTTKRSSSCERKETEQKSQAQSSRPTFSFSLKGRQNLQNSNQMTIYN